MAERLIKSLSHFFGPAALAPGEKAKRLLSGLGAILAGLACLIASVVQFIQVNHFIGFFLLTVGSGLVVCVLVFRNQRNLTHIYRILMLLLEICFVYLLATSDPHGYKVLWIFIFPPAVFYLLDRYEALLYAGIFFFMPLSSFCYQIFSPGLVIMMPDSSSYFFALFLSWEPSLTFQRTASTYTQMV